MKINKVGIVGAGYVGSAMHRFFNGKLKHGDLKIYDVNKKLDERDTINKCDLGIVCVPTEMNEDGTVNTSIVEEVIEWLKTPIILIKSTIPPKTTEMLKRVYGKRIVFSPEYVGESKYYIPEKYMDTTDMTKHDFFIFGGDKEDIKPILDLFVKICGPTKRYIQTDATTAELTKYMENTFFATKITFCQEWYEIAKTFGVDYHELRECWLADPRINPMHTLVFKDERGFGGKCLPKDTNGIVATSKEAGYKADLLAQVIKSNEGFRQVTN